MSYNSCLSVVLSRDISSCGRFAICTCLTLVSPEIRPMSAKKSPYQNNMMHKSTSFLYRFTFS